MSQHDHNFDWHGFSFALKILALFFMTAVAAQSGWAYVHTSTNTAPTPLQLVEAVSNAQTAQAAMLSSSTPERVINALTIKDTIPAEGKFIAADLVNMTLSLYQDGTKIAEFPIKLKGRAGTPWETPSGFYAIQTKEKNHFSSIGKVYMPFSMQFYGNYFIHGMTYYPDGTPTSASFSGGCIKLETGDAQQVFEFVDVGTKVFVYDSKENNLPSLVLAPRPIPPVSGAAYLIADIDTGDVLAEQNATEVRPIASITKLMTSLVANEIISLDKKVSVSEGHLFNPPNLENNTRRTFLVDDLFYPLLMQSSNGIAEALASYYGKHGFVRWMNTTAAALDMSSTNFADASGASADNTSNTEDLFRLATYLSNKKSFVLKITDTKSKTITASDGSSYQIKNVNAPADTEPFDGGKVGHTAAALDTMLSTLSLTVGENSRRIAVIVLGSENQAEDTQHLADWIKGAAIGETSQAACASCTEPPLYRKIEL
jgi:D-alanyl-D-alanine endopeptidase (penicillin-binding protein 7)